MARLNSPSPLRVGLCGAGMMGATHAAAYAGIPGAKLAAVWDTDLKRAEALAARFGGTVYAHRDDLIQAVDIVDICLPTPCHLEQIQAAAAKGKAVFCEKPLGRTLEECDAAIGACKRAKVPLLVGHVVRFFPEYRTLRNTILNGDLGDVGVLRMKRVVCSPGPAGSWYWDFEASGGCVLDTAIHDLDWLNWTLGRPASLYGVGFRDAPSLKDLAYLTLQWSGGAIAHLESSWSHDTFATSFEAAGRDGIAEFDLRDCAALQVAYTQAASDGGGNVVPESPLAKSPYQAELEHFVAVVRGAAKPLIKPEEAREAVELALACLDALRSRQPVRLPSRRGGPSARTAKPRARALPAAHPE